MFMFMDCVYGKVPCWSKKKQNFVAFSPVAPPLHEHVTSLWALRARALSRAWETRKGSSESPSERAYETAPIIPRPSRLNNGSIQQLIYRWRHAGADEWSSAEILTSVLAVCCHSRWSDRGARISGLFSITDGRRVHLLSDWRPGMRENMHKCLL